MKNKKSGFVKRLGIYLLALSIPFFLVVAMVQSQQYMNIEKEVAERNSKIQQSENRAQQIENRAQQKEQQVNQKQKELDRKNTEVDAIRENLEKQLTLVDAKQVELEQVQKDLIESNKALVTDISVLSSSERIEKIAVEQLGMRKATSDEIVRVSIKGK